MTCLDSARQRIVVALLARLGKFSRQPPVSEIEYIGKTVNHGQFAAKLRSLGQYAPADELGRFANHISLCWFRLAIEHLEDAQYALQARRFRAVFSRSYYAAYNASKSVRYLVLGAVTLKGDDHQKASTDLPDDFPSVERWSGIVTSLYEHRLRADYDNWVSTSTDNTMTDEEAFEHASQFVDACRAYLGVRFGVEL